MTEMNFKSIPDTAEIYVSMDGGKYEQISENTFTSGLSKGGHTVSVLCLDKTNLKKKFRGNSKKKPLPICVYTSIMSFEQTFDIWVKKQDSTIDFGYAVSHEKDALECVCENPYLRTEAVGMEVNSYTYLQVVKSRAEYIALQLLNMLIILSPLIILITVCLVMEVPLLKLSYEEWVENYYFPRRLRPLPAIISECTVFGTLYIFFFVRYVLKLRKQLETIVKKSEVL